jgi:hypothetical protein
MSVTIKIWLRHYATSRKVAGSIPGEVNFFFPIYLIFPATLGHGFYSSSKRNEYLKQKIMFLWSGELPMRRDYNLTTISEPTI